MENQDLRNQIAELKTENQRLTQLSSLPKDDSLANEQLKELLRLRGEVGKLRGATESCPKTSDCSAKPDSAIPVAPPETASRGSYPTRFLAIRRLCQTGKLHAIAMWP